MNRKQKKMLFRIIIAFIMMITFNLIPSVGIVRLLLFIALYLIIGYDIIVKAVKGILNGRVFSENFLMVIATVGAFVLAVYSRSGDYNESAAVMLFYQVGELFQSCAVGKSRRSISRLMDIRPDYANTEKDGMLIKMPPEEIDTGTVIIVQPGERIPIDGVIESGSASLDTAALTGESMPRSVSEGDEVLSGCICTNGVLKIRTTKAFGESTVSKILDLVENAGSRKSRSENFISKFSGIYTPFVCFSALALAVLPPLISMIAGQNADFENWIYRALTFLVISCPCALVISIPLSFFAGIGGAGREGILIKGSNYLEALSHTKCIVFDKTGTLTHGVFKVSEIHSKDIEKARLLEYAAHAECASSHPISLSLQKAYGKTIDRSRVSDIEEISGFGITAMVDGVSVAVGNTKLMELLSIQNSESVNTGTVVHVAVDRNYCGYIIISDDIKPTSANAIALLKEAGIRKTIILTGDSEKAAEKCAAALSVDEVHSGLLPSDKVMLLESILASHDKKSKVAFVGDGINHAPVLSRADIGIAMGAMGSDAAIEAADVVLMDDDPMKIPKAIQISRKCMNIVRQNIVFSLAVKFLCLLLGALGITNMWAAIFADVGVMVIAVLNAIRTLKTPK